MKGTYVRKGDVLEHTATAALQRGDVVALPVGVGVTQEDIPAGGTGIVHLVGVFSMPKKANEAIASGALLYLDTANDCVTATKGSLTVIVGMAAAPATAAASTVDVRIDRTA